MARLYVTELSHGRMTGKIAAAGGPVNWGNRNLESVQLFDFRLSTVDGLSDLRVTCRAENHVGNVVDDFLEGITR